MTKQRLINFKSNAKLTPFAPEWNFIIYENIIDKINFKKIASFILNKEKEILKNTTHSKKIGSVDGYTGLGKNSLTSRYENFNVLKWNKDEIKKLKKIILKEHDDFLSLLNIEKPKSLWIQCWANVMRKGEKINTHIHSIKPDSYLGGHVCIQCINTFTGYINPLTHVNNPEIFKSDNEVGKITLFQNCLPHYTSTHEDNKKERITIAFDLMIINPNDKNVLQLY